LALIFTNKKEYIQKNMFKQKHTFFIGVRSAKDFSLLKQKIENWMRKEIKKDDSKMSHFLEKV
jgi:hypothetical protein